MPPFVLVDGSYFLFRAFHALPPLTTSTGLHTNAIRGAISAIQKLMRRTQPTHMAVIFDTPEPTFRHVPCRHKELNLFNWSFPQVQASAQCTQSPTSPNLHLKMKSRG